MTYDAFPFLSEVPVWPTHAELRQETLTAWKEQWGVFTAHSPGVDEPWMALCVPRAHKRLSGYSLTEEELADPMLLFAGYCRLIEEMGLCAYGDTEENACIDLANQLGFVKP